MDSAKTDRDLGTFWAPEDRAWLWYNDTIETHAFALRALTELEPDDDRAPRPGAVAVAQQEAQPLEVDPRHRRGDLLPGPLPRAARATLGVREDAHGHRRRRDARDFVFEPDEYTGKQQPGRRRRATRSIPRPCPRSWSRRRPRASPSPRPPGTSRPRSCPRRRAATSSRSTRRYFRRVNDGDEWVLEPLAEGAELAPGDQVEVQLSIRAKHAAEYVHLRDPRGAGFEPETLHLALQVGSRASAGTRRSATAAPTSSSSGCRPGEYTFKYRLRANMAGTFKVAPATLQSMYAPEFTAYSAGRVVEIGAAQ